MDIERIGSVQYALELISGLSDNLQGVLTDEEQQDIMQTVMQAAPALVRGRNCLRFFLTMVCDFLRFELEHIDSASEVEELSKHVVNFYEYGEDFIYDEYNESLTDAPEDF